jgi:hypothetical protein
MLFWQQTVGLAVYYNRLSARKLQPMLRRPNGESLGPKTPPRKKRSITISTSRHRGTVSALPVDGVRLTPGAFVNAQADLSRLLPILVNGERKKVRPDDKSEHAARIRRILALETAGRIAERLADLFPILCQPRVVGEIVVYTLKVQTVAPPCLVNAERNVGRPSRSQSGAPQKWVAVERARRTNEPHP